MAAAKPGFFSRALGALDTTRRVLTNLVFLLILLAILAAVFASGKKVKDKTTLVLALKGDVVEQYSGDPVEVAINRALGSEVEQVQLRDFVRALKSAAGDNKISTVLLRTDQLASAGVSTLREMARAIQEFRKSGKEIVSYAYGYDQRGLYLAAHTNRIYMHPEGGAFLEGLGRYRTYYRDMLDKLGVTMNVFRVGEYKSAVEPYLLNGPSPEAQEADRYWLDSLWTVMLDELARARNLQASDLSGLIDEFPQRLAAVDGDLARLSIEAKLVDELLTPDQMRKLLTEKGAPDDADKSSFRRVGMLEYLKAIGPAKPGKEAVGIIVAEGTIVDGEQPQGTIGGETVAKLIRQAREDEAIKAVVLRVDSPGGSGFASELIRRELEVTKSAGKPVVISMGDFAASGGYWISMTSDKIYAQPTTITGSIGIFGLFPTVEKTLDKVGIHTGGTTTTWLAGALDPTRALDPRIGELLQTVINHGYDSFIGKVAEARSQDKAAIDQVARGRVWSGAQALERGLVDEIGYLDDAIADAARRAGLAGDFGVRYVEKKPEGFQAVLASLLGAHSRAVIGDVLAAVPLLKQPRVRQASADLRFLDGHLQQPLRTYAHCLCEIE